MTGVQTVCSSDLMWTDNDFGDPRADDMTELTQRLMRCATLIEQADGQLIISSFGGVQTQHQRHGMLW